MARAHVDIVDEERRAVLARALERLLERRVDRDRVPDRRAAQRPGGAVQEPLRRGVQIRDPVVCVDPHCRDRQRRPKIEALPCHAAARANCAASAMGDDLRDQAQNLGRGWRSQHGAAQVGRCSGVIHVPPKVFARASAAEIRAVEAQHLFVVTRHHLGEGGALRYGGRRRAPQLVRNAGQQPRTPLNAAADHDAICARQIQGSASGRGIRDVSIGENRNPDRRLDPCDRRPIRASLVELAARAAVDRDHPDARRLGPHSQLRRVQQILVPAQPSLQRHGHLHRAYHGVDQAQRMVQIPHQRGARTAVGHLLGRATHVDIDDPRTLGLHHARGLRHGRWFPPCELHRRPFDTKRQFRPLPRAGARVEDVDAGDHFGHDETRAE